MIVVGGDQCSPVSPLQSYGDIKWEKFETICHHSKNITSKYRGLHRVHRLYRPVAGEFSLIDLSPLAADPNLMYQIVQCHGTAIVLCHYIWGRGTCTTATCLINLLYNTILLIMSLQSSSQPSIRLGKHQRLWIRIHVWSHYIRDYHWWVLLKSIMVWLDYCLHGSHLFTTLVWYTL